METSSGRPVTMDDLIPGTCIRHLRWGTEGIVKVDEDCEGGPLVHVKWRGHFVDDEISDQGPVRPGDLQIIVG